jgi:hypothetical protein
VVNGEEHWANAGDPQIPAALAPVVRGIVSLHNFRKQPLHRRLGSFTVPQLPAGVRPRAFRGKWLIRHRRRSCRRCFFFERNAIR